jgi:hypothetical protein
MTLVNRILFGLRAFFALVVIVAFIWQSLANAYLKAQLAQSQANGTACHLANDEFASAVAEQNKAVEELKQSSLAHERRAQAEAENAQKSARAYFKIAKQLRKAASGKEVCSSADQLLNSYLKAAP